MPVQTILVATDFSEQACAAADWALALAGALGAKIIVAHVFDLPLVGFLDGSLLASAKMAARMSDEAQAALAAEVTRIRGGGVDVEGLLRQGDAREMVPVLATAEGAGLVVVGSHGRRGLARALIGSVAESIVRSSIVPVAVIRPGAQ
jgi:nucleotide-binding universal stress UspA family protein